MPVSVTILTAPARNSGSNLLLVSGTAPLPQRACLPDSGGSPLATWRTQITNWHRSRVTNGPTEAANNLAKLIKRVSFGITNFDHYRTRVLLYAGKPDWTLLDTLTPR
ncbi:transposase [Candidatus Poriferisodalis sp.]|uniref:transposase n=1 Tax=Candidatus Poriferisodalis sp. TaxID=3101277 RepID=UPI003B5AE9DB